MALAPVSGKMFVFHHLTELGGSIADPMSKVVALKGMGLSAMPIQLELDSFEDQDEVKVPTWANIKKVLSPSDVAGLSAGTAKKRFKQMVSLPPFLVNSINSAPSLSPDDLLIHFLAAINFFDEAFKDVEGYPKAEKEARDVILFLWGVSNFDISPLPFVDCDDAIVKSWSEKLHSEFISLPSAAPTKDGEVMGPSNTTMSNLTSSLVLLKEFLEKHQDTVAAEKEEKEEKKNRFKSMTPFAQKMILFAMTEDCRTAATSVTEGFKLILEQSSKTTQTNMLNSVLQ
jgi:hypothetical protein